MSPIDWEKQNIKHTESAPASGVKHVILSKGELEERVLNVGQANAWGACSTVILFFLAGEIELGVRYMIEHPDVRVPCGSSPQGGNYCFTDYGFVTASTAGDQRHAEKWLEKTGFTSTARVQKNKNSHNKCKFWMIDMPTLVKNLGYDPESFGLKAIG